MRKAGLRELLPTLASRDPETVREKLADTAFDPDTMRAILQNWDARDAVGAYEIWQEREQSWPASEAQELRDQIIDRVVGSDPNRALDALMNEASTYSEERSWARALAEHWSLKDHVGGLDWARSIENPEWRGRLTRMLLSTQRP